MKLNRLVVVTAAAYSVPGFGFTFAPSEILVSIGATPSPTDTWLAQLLGAALLGLAFLNWLQRYALVGGVFGRPLLLTNLVFVTASFFASLSAWRHQGGAVFVVPTLIFGLLSAAFGLRVFLPARAQGTRPGTGAA